MKKDINRITLLFLIFNIQLGVTIWVQKPISWYNVTTPFVLSVIFVNNRHRIKIDRYSFVIITLFAGVTLLVPALEMYNPPILNFFAHLLALFTAIGFVIALSPEYLWHVFKMYFLVAIPVAFLDVGAFLGMFPVLNTCSSKLPGIEYCGIGISTGFATHGVVLVSGIIAGICVIGCKKRGTKSYYATFSIILLMIMSLILSQSRSGIFALVIGILPFLLYKLKVITRRSATFAVIVIGLAVTSIFFSLILISFRTPTVISRIEQIVIAIDIIVSHPFSGIGWNEFFPTYYDKILHNTPLNYFVSNGLFSGLLFLGTILLPIFAYIRFLLSPFNADPFQWFQHTSFGIFSVVLVERLLAKGTPSVQLLIASLLFFIILCYRRYSGLNH